MPCTGMEKGNSLQARGDGWVMTVAKAVATIMAFYHLAYVSGFFSYIGVYAVQVQSHKGLSLALMLLFVPLAFPARKGTTRKGLPWYDILLILMGVAGAGYYFFFNRLAMSHYYMGMATTYEMVLLAALLIAMIEAGRRTLGLAMPILVVCFLIYVLFCGSFPGFLQAKSLGLSFMVQATYLSFGGIFGMPLGVAATIVMMFIIFSSLLTHTGAAKFFVNFALSVVGFTRGGPAKAAVFASAFEATMSGSVSGNVAGSGSVTIPLMINTGYQPHFAGAVEAVASKGGQITPPVMGAVAFIMAEFLGITYLQVCIAAALPALLYFIAVYVQVDFEAARMGLRGLSRKEMPSFWKSLKEGWHFLLPIVLLVILIIVLKYSVELAGFYAVVFLFLVSMFKKESRLGPAKLVAAFNDFARTVVIAGIACALAGPILASLDVTGLGTKIAIQLVILAGANKFLLLMVAAAACFVFGMGMTSVAIYVILVVLVAPALVKTGVNPIAAHLFVIYWGNVSFITPPVAIAAYVAAAIAGADPMKTGWAACRLGIVSFIIPFIFAYNPALLLIGSPGVVALATITAIVGVVSLAAGVEGWIIREANWTERVLLIAGGILLIIPGWKTDLTGLAIIALVLIYHLARGTDSRKNPLTTN